MEITHLVVNGCSWTYCQGLDDPKTQGWPFFLAKKLGVPVVNLAVPGSGNDTIHRRTYEYMFEDYPESKPLYVIAWTQTWRREAWCRKFYTDNLPNGYCTISLPSKSPDNYNEYALLDNWSEEDFYRRLMLYRASLESLFRFKDAPHITSFFADPRHEQNLNSQIKFAGMSNFLLSETNHIDSFYEITERYPKLPCGHDGYESMPVLADFIYDKIIEIYGEIKPINGNYLTLKTFNTIDTTGSIINSLWL